MDLTRACYRDHGHGISFRQLCEELTTLKQQPATAWLRDMDSQSLQQALRDLAHAFTNFFAHRARYPRFKSKKTDAPRFRIPQRVSIRDGHVIIPKIGRVRIRQHRPVEGVTKSATFKRDSSGHWFVSIVAHIDLPTWPRPAPTPETTIGVDVGLHDFAVMSDGERVANPRFARRQERVLRRAHRNVSRKAKGGHNRGKARVRLARIYRRIGTQRADFLHQQSRRLIDRAQTIAIEDLNVRALARSKLRCSFADVAHGRFRSFLAYKADWSGKQLVMVDRYFPSSKRCSVCYAINPTLTLGDRSWRCGCGVWHDRDRNAAVNLHQEALRLLAAGYPESQNASP